MANRRIPKKITPDGLTDAIVAVEYKTSLPPEAAFGFFWQAFTQLGFEHIPVRQKSNPSLPALGWFKREGILLQLTPDLLLFNGVSRPADSLQWQEGASGYIGWSEFHPIILEVLGELSNKEIVQTYSLVGVRYINVLPWPELNKQLLVQLPTLPSAFESVEEFQYRASTMTTDKFRVNLQLADNIQLPQEKKTGALFDVEVWHPAPTNSLDQIPKALEETHSKMKEVFFGLLSDEFLALLKPEY